MVERTRHGDDDIQKRGPTSEQLAVAKRWTDSMEGSTSDFADASLALVTLIVQEEGLARKDRNEWVQEGMLELLQAVQDHLPEYSQCFASYVRDKVQRHLRRASAIARYHRRKFRQLEEDDLPPTMPDLAAMMMQEEARRSLSDVMRTLHKRYRHILELRYGLNGNEPHTLAQVAQSEGVKRARIYALEATGIRKLREYAAAGKIPEDLM